MKLELFPKQEKYFQLSNRINVFSGGIQSSKTTTGAMRFVAHGIAQFRDKTDNFLVAADTYKTLFQATIPTFVRMAKGYGQMNLGHADFKTKWGSTVYFRTGTHPESAEGIQNVRRVWLDEGGKVSLYFFENLMGRAARLEAPVDITTTPYAMNWLAKMCRDAKEGKRNDVSLIHCKSVESPYFSKAEYERQRGLLDPRRFRMKYDGEFGQMEGLVFDLYEQCIIPHKPLENADYYAGIDWGYFPDPFCVVLRAVVKEHDKRVHYRVGEFYRNYMTPSEIVSLLKGYHSLYKFKKVICDPSQPANIAELCKAGIPALGACNVDLRARIDAHYTLMKSGRFFIFRENNELGLDEYATYHYREKRELGIDDDLKDRDRVPVDQNNHGSDCDIYLTGELEQELGERRTPKAPGGTEPPRGDLAKRLAWLKRPPMAGGGSPYS